MATSVEEENLAKTTMPPLEKITTFHTEPSSPSSISRRSLRMVIVVIAAIIGIILMM